MEADSPVWREGGHDMRRETVRTGERGTVIFLYLTLVLGLLVLGYSLFSVFSSGERTEASSVSMTRMSLTPFDKETGLRLMDANRDGRCDACGMPVEMCLDSGEIQCTMMGGDGVGKLGSAHLHADWKIYLDGKPFDFTDLAGRHQKQMGGDTTIMDTSSFIHLHSAQLPERGGDVLHVHATNVPLWLFFESVGMKLTKDCLVVDDKSFCTNDIPRLRMYVNGKETGDFGDYVIRNLDKILITSSDDENIIYQQLASVTDYAQVHADGHDES